MNIVLIGYRGTGKSTVAKILSEYLRWPVFNMDQAIVAEAGMSIPQIVANYGWEFFRDLEAKITKKASKQDRTIIDAGGGVVIRPENIEHLRNNGIVIWLKANPETIVARIREDTNRPSLTGGKTFLEEVEEVLTERIPKYRSAAHLEIDTEGLLPQEVAEEILKVINERIARD
jgi:shikimate kinase